MPAFSEDRLAALKSEYELAAKEPSNLALRLRPGRLIAVWGFAQWLRRGTSSPKPRFPLARTALGSSNAVAGVHTKPQSGLAPRSRAARAHSTRTHHSAPLPNEPAFAPSDHLERCGESHSPCTRSPAGANRFEGTCQNSQGDFGLYRPSPPKRAKGSKPRSA